MISREGQAFHDSSADEALYEALNSYTKVPVHQYTQDINDKVFAEASAKRLLELINA